MVFFVISACAYTNNVQFLEGNSPPPSARDGPLEEPDVSTDVESDDDALPSIRKRGAGGRLSNPRYTT